MRLQSIAAAARGPENQKAGRQPSVEVVVMSRRATFSVAIVMIVLVGAGLLLSPQSFAENLLAESVGVVVSVVIALALVERLLDRERAGQWQDVRALIMRSIWPQITDFAFECVLTIPRLDAGVEEDYLLLSTHDLEMPTAGSAAALGRLRKRLQKEAKNLMAAPTKHQIYRAARGYAGMVERDL
jgi:hypothetical protein